MTLGWCGKVAVTDTESSVFTSTFVLCSVNIGNAIYGVEHVFYQISVLGVVPWVPQSTAIVLFRSTRPQTEEVKAAIFDELGGARVVYPRFLSSTLPLGNNVTKWKVVK